MTDQRLQEIQGRLDAARPGPWIYEPSEAIDGVPDPNIHYVSDHVSVGDDDPPLCSLMFEADARFIANAPQDVTWLIQAHYRLRSRIAYLEGRLEDEGDTYGKECPDAHPS